MDNQEKQVINQAMLYAFHRFSEKRITLFGKLIIFVLK